jgi:hypothetical protein
VQVVERYLETVGDFHAFTIANAERPGRYIPAMNRLPDAQSPVFMRIYRGMEDSVVITRMDFHQLLEENAGMEEIVWRVALAMYTGEAYDDSDYRAHVLCLYVRLGSADQLRQAYMQARGRWIDQRPAAEGHLAPI